MDEKIIFANMQQSIKSSKWSLATANCCVPPVEELQCFCVRIRRIFMEIKRFLQNFRKSFIYNIVSFQPNLMSFSGNFTKYSRNSIMELKFKYVIYFIIYYCLYQKKHFNWACKSIKYIIQTSTNSCKKIESNVVKN